MDDTSEGGSVNELSTQDKELLERWSKMQKETKPFVHPIRKHMNELMQLKAETIQHQQQQQPQEQQSNINTKVFTAHSGATAISSAETVKGQRIVNRVCSTNNTNISTLQFTNLVPKTKNGNYSLVAENTVVLTTVASNISLTASHQATSVKPSVNMTTTFSTAAKLTVVTTTLTDKNKATSATTVVSGSTVSSGKGTFNFHTFFQQGELRILTGGRLTFVTFPYRIQSMLIISNTRYLEFSSSRTILSGPLNFLINSNLKNVCYLRGYYL